MVCFGRFIFGKTLLVLLLIFGFAALFSGKVYANERSLVLITELQVGKGSAEFIEIENVSGVDLDLADFNLQYHNASSTDWRNKTLSFLDPEDTLLARGERALLLSSGYAPEGSNPVATFASGLADGGGAVRVLPKDEAALFNYVAFESESENLEEGEPIILDEYGDKLFWGVVDPPECQIAPSHREGESLKRFPSGDGYLVDTGLSGADFYVSNVPTPSVVDEYGDQDPFSIDEVVNYCGMPEDGEPEDPQSPGLQDDPDLPPPFIYLKIQITELFTDPVSPQKDSEDEYVELFNPNEVEVNLAGYKLQTGLNSTYSYTFGDLIMMPGEYFALSRLDSKLTLSNTSSKATLLDPNGEIISESDPYDKSYQAQSWQLYGGVWQWSSSPTPSAPNVQGNLSGASATAKKVVAKPVTKKATAKKTAAKTVAKKASSSPAKAADNNGFTYVDDAGNTKIQPYVIWGAGVLLLGYGLWEYRWDAIRLFRGKG